MAQPDVGRYQRRTTRVDDAMLGVYLAGGTTRRIKGALAPLLRGGPLSKDAASRLVARLREDVDTWRTRDLADEDIRDVFMDGWYPKSAASWTEVVASLAARHLARPILAVIDGHPGLTNALRSHGPGIAIQRCTAA